MSAHWALGFLEYVTGTETEDRVRHRERKREKEREKERKRERERAKNAGCVGAGNQVNEPPVQELEKRELLILRELVWPGRVRTLKKMA